MSGTSKITGIPAPLLVQLDAAAESAADRAAHPDFGYEAVARHSRTAGALHAAEVSQRDDGAMSRAERIGFWIYVAMGLFCAAVLVAAAITAIVS